VPPEDQYVQGEAKDALIIMANDLFERDVPTARLPALCPRRGEEHLLKEPQKHYLLYSIADGRPTLM